jgi:hypothetical protein
MDGTIKQWQGRHAAATAAQLQLYRPVARAKLEADLSAAPHGLGNAGKPLRDATYKGRPKLVAYDKCGYGKQESLRCVRSMSNN